MTAQQLIYRGTLDLGDGEGPREGLEVWADGTTAVAFAGSTVEAVLHDLARSLTDDRRLVLSGLGNEGDPGRWEATEPEHVEGRWVGASVRWPDGTTWSNCEVAWSQYGVRVVLWGQTPRELIGARTEVVGQQRWIVDGSVRILASAGQAPCGCGGTRR